MVTLKSAANNVVSLDSLMKAKLEALKAKLSEQKELIRDAEIRLAKAQSIEKEVIDSSAYISISFFNAAPSSEYRLESAEIYLDNEKKPLDQVYFAPLKPGCHEVVVKAKYTRLKNSLLDRFKNIKKVEIITKSQAFIAQEGFRIELEIEGFEARNSLARFFAGPDLRFNKLVRPNFLPGAPLVALDSIVNQGRVHLDFTSENPDYYLLKKNITIDNLPILINESHDHIKDKNTLFDKPISEGEHKLKVTLVFAPKKKIGTGPTYNFKLSFERDFAVIRGQMTQINLITLPKGGLKGWATESRYARVHSRILATDEQGVFINDSCKEYGERKPQGE
jgi:hypothetical protein